MELNFNTNGIFQGGYTGGVNQSTDSGRTESKRENAPVGGEYNVRFKTEESYEYSSMKTNALENTKGMSSIEVDANVKSFASKLGLLKAAYRGKPILFDIYAIMDLMQEMAQKMRDSLRELRNVENQTIQSNIRAQAEVQRGAAYTAMITGVVFCAAQVAVTGFAAGKQIKDITKQSALMKQGGVDVMTTQTKIANSVGSDSATQKMSDTIQKQYPDAYNDVQMTEPKTGNYNSQQTKYDNAQGKLSEMLDYKTLSEKETQDPQSLTTEESSRLKELSQKYNNKVPDKDALDKAQTEVADAAAELAKAKHAEGQRVMDLNEKEVQVAADEYKACRQAAKDEMAGNKKGEISEKTQENLDKATAKLQVSRMKQVENIRKCIKEGMVSPDAATLGVKESAGKMLVEAHDSAFSREDAMVFKKSDTYMSVVMGVNQAVGNLAQNIINGIKEIISASATELQANQKMQEDQLDQIKDLFAQELSVIQKVFQLFEAVTQKESSTIENIIMA